MRDGRITGACMRWNWQAAINAGLAIWFTIISATLAFGPVLLGRGVRLGWDAIVHTHAAQALVAGTDPWAVELFGISFAAPPPSLLPYLPFAWLPDVLIAAAWIAIGAASSIYAVRRIGLAWWWLLFPPLVLGVLAGSTAPLVLALLVRGGAVADAAAILARTYAALPVLILGRWRGLVIAAAVVVATLPFLGWSQFIAALPSITSTLSIQSNGGLSATVEPILFVVAAGALILLGRRRAAWLVVPGLWPDTQLYYTSIALPVIGEMPIVALALASPASPGLIAASLAAQAIAERLRPRLAARMRFALRSTSKDPEAA
jgi:hypothetical protein